MTFKLENYLSASFNGAKKLHCVCRCLTLTITWSMIESRVHTTMGHLPFDIHGLQSYHPSDLDLKHFFRTFVIMKKVS